MNYRKPEVKTLGEAAGAIGQLGIKPPTPHIEPVPPCKGPFNPAYDPDE